MAITFDTAKRASNLVKHGLDLADAAKVFDGTVIEFVDDRFDYGEVRVVTIGMLGTQVVVVVWADWDEDQRIISMRRATKGETDDYFAETSV